MIHSARSSLTLAAVLMSGATSAFAADLDKPMPPAAAPAMNCVNPSPSIQSSLGAAGDPGGIRAYLDTKGICYNFTYIGEVLGNPSGGVKQGATYEGRLDMNLDVDLERLAGIGGLALHAEAFQIHGRGLSGNNTKDLFTVSGIEAYPDTKLYEAWLEEKFDDGKILLRAGQLGADTEFFLSQTAGLFVDSTFGWPASFANDLPNGGPAYPAATPGVRVKVLPADNVTLLAAIFNGDPIGPFAPGESPIAQQRDLGGVDFRLKDPPLVMGEFQYAYNQEKDAKDLPGTVKFGYWHSFEDFPAANQSGLTYRGNDAFYGIIDQAVYKTDSQSANVFLRASGSPGEYNLIDFYVDGGGSFTGLIPGRPNDVVGVAAAYGHISSATTAGDIAVGAFPLIRDYQALIEATYQINIVDGLSIQPDVQYLFHPGAHGVAIPGTNVPTHDAAVFALRATVHY